MKFRAEGGTHDDANLVALRGAHHRAVHRGTLRITGNPIDGLAFAHADGTPYGRPVDPTCLDVHRDVTLGLKALGLSSREADAASRAAVAHVGTDALLGHVDARRLARLAGRTRLGLAWMA